MRAAGPAGLALGIVVLCVAAAVALSGNGEEGAGGSRAQARTPGAPAAGGGLDVGTAPTPLTVRLGDPQDPVRLRFERPPKAGLLFDVGTGQVLWRRRPTRRLKIASLTKIMTALVVADELAPQARVPITAKALRYRGSGVGLLPKGKRIRVGAMLHGLMLPSGNDAARALAERVAGSLSGFVQLMNAKASALGLQCTRFSSPDGYVDRGNFSCAADLAALGRALLRRPQLARIVRKPSAVLPFPIKGGRLHLANNNPLLRRRYRGVTGIKTGYTAASGLCLVATARRGPVHLGVVLLGSPNWDRQARRLLDRGFEVALAR